MKVDNVEVGKHALNLFVVAPARFNHQNETAYDLCAMRCFVQEDAAIIDARAQTHSFGKEYCVYRLVDVYSGKGHES